MCCGVLDPKVSNLPHPGSPHVSTSGAHTIATSQVLGVLRSQWRKVEGIYKAQEETPSIVLVLFHWLRSHLEPVRIDPGKWWMGTFVLLVLYEGQV